MSSSGLRHWVYGSVTNKVLRNTCGPVMVVRNVQPDQAVV